MPSVVVTSAVVMPTVVVTSAGVVTTAGLVTSARVLPRDGVSVVMVAWVVTAISIEILRV